MACRVSMDNTHTHTHWCGGENLQAKLWLPHQRTKRRSNGQAMGTVAAGDTHRMAVAEEPRVADHANALDLVTPSDGSRMCRGQGYGSRFGAAKTSHPVIPQEAGYKGRSCGHF